MADEMRTLLVTVSLWLFSVAAVACGRHSARLQPSAPSRSASGATPGVALFAASAGLPEVPRAAVRVDVTRSAIVMTPTDGPASAAGARIELESGAVPVAALRGGANGFIVTQLYEALERVRTTLSAADADVPATHTVVLRADPSLPWQTIARVVYSAGQQRFEGFALVVVSGPREAALSVELPRYRSSPRARPAALDGANDPAAIVALLADEMPLSVELRAEGISVTGPGGRVQPGCEHVGDASPTLARLNGAYDFAGLRRCLVRVRAALAAQSGAGSTSTLVVAAGRERTYGDVLGAIVAARETRDGAADLYPTVQLGILN